MDYSPEELDDLTHMRDLLGRLKGCADARVEAMERMKIAETPLEMQRQVRAIKATADLVVCLYSPRRKGRVAAPRPARATSTQAAITRELQTISKLLDRPGNKASPAASTPSSRVASKVFERAAAAAAPPVASRVAPPIAPQVAPKIPTPPEPSVPTKPDREESTVEMLANTQLDVMTSNCARAAGIWPDGALYKKDECGWIRHARTAPMTIAPGTSEAAIEAMIDAEKLNRANAVARAFGRWLGFDLAGNAWEEGDPDFYTVSVNRAAGLNQRAAGEIPAAQGVPWWIVHVPRDEPD